MSMYTTQSSYLRTIKAELQAATVVWNRHGLEYGRALRKAREALKADGGYFNTLLDELGIPRSTAYYWLDEFEISIGVKTKKVKPAQPEEPDDDEVLALPDATELTPKQKYAKNPRGIKTLQSLADRISELNLGSCTVKASTTRDGLAVSTGVYNCRLELVGVTRQKLTNALNALVGE